MQDRINEIEELRKVMGTDPSSQPSKRTRIIPGCTEISVNLVEGSYPENPYRTIFEAATATWGNDEYNEKWERTSIEGRILVVKAALEGKTLPQALEAPNFTWTVNYTSRSAFDQVARVRIGGTVYSSGTRDNNKLDASFILPSAFLPGGKLEKFREKVIKHVNDFKDLYEEIISEGQGSWQAARCINPMGLNHPYKISLGYLALRGQCSRRLKFCEQEDTVATFWLMRQTILDKFPMLGIYLRPGCDYSRKCQYSQAYSLSEAFGCLFAPCGRNKYDGDYIYATFNEACTDAKKLEHQLNIKIPAANEQLPSDFEPTETDLFYFNMD